MAKVEGAVRAKGRCCKDSPRCKRCPVVCKRLAGEGFLERVDKRTYLVVVPPSKAALKRARAKKVRPLTA